MGNRLYALAVAAGSLLLFLGVGRPLNPVPSGPGRAMIETSLEQFVDVPELGDVRFDFDSSRISPDAVRVLDANVMRIKRLAPSQILVEGHTDEWGSAEYNLCLGDRRARVVRDALVRRGWSASAINTVSYGKDRPRCLEHHRVCWSENRRVHLRVSGLRKLRPEARAREAAR